MHYRVPKSNEEGAIDATFNWKFIKVGIVGTKFGPKFDKGFGAIEIALHSEQLEQYGLDFDRNGDECLPARGEQYNPMR